MQFTEQSESLEVEVCVQASKSLKAGLEVMTLNEARSLFVRIQVIS